MRLIEIQIMIQYGSPHRKQVMQKVLVWCVDTMLLTICLLDNGSGTAGNCTYCE